MRRQFYRGEFAAPKTKHGRRDVPIPAQLARKLRKARAEARSGGGGDPVFANYRGGLLRPDNVMKHHLRPILGEVGASWAVWHTFRHTFASVHIERGTNIVRLSRLMGHHAPTVTLSTYAHLMDNDLGDPLDLGDVLAATEDAAGAVPDPATQPASAPERAAERVERRT